MEWLTARKLIAQRVPVNTDLNTPKSAYRKVLEVDAYLKRARFSYQSERGFIVAIGKKTSIEIPWTMLEACYAHLNAPGGYSGASFRKRYGAQAKEHPCHVHVVGRIFVKADIAVANGTRYAPVQKSAGEAGV